MPTMLPPAAPSEAPASGPPAAAAGRGDTADGGPWDHAAAGFQNQGTDLCGAEDAWKRLLEDLRGPGDAAGVEHAAPREQHQSAAAGGDGAAAVRGGDGEGRRKRSRDDDDGGHVPCPSDRAHDTDKGSHGRVVEVQPADGVLLAQSNRETCASIWVVNSGDWIDVEHVLRRMLKCEASECHAFYSIGYVFFRSCAVSHVTSPSEFLKNGMQYHFPGTEVTVAVTSAHEEGVLEIECFLEYTP